MFDIQRFADTLTGSFDVVLPLELYIEPGNTMNKTIKIANPKANLTLAEAEAVTVTLNQTNFFGMTIDGQSVPISVSFTTTPYTEEKQTLTLDLNE